MRRGKMGFAIASVAAVAFIGASASGQVVWTDDMEAYAPGSGIMGQGNWTAWGDDVAWDSNVTNANANSGTNSLDVVGDSDSVYRFNINHGIIDCGQWSVSTQLFVPSGLTGQTYFILLNSYDGVSDLNWSTQVIIDAGVGSFVDTGPNGATLPLIFDTWVEIRVDIDLDNDTQSFYIGGDLLYTGSWTEWISGAGDLELEAMDLFANGASSVYYDDFQLEQTGDCPTAVCLGLEVDRLVAGTKSTWTITDANGSNGVVALVWGTQDGTTNLNGFAGYCASFGIKGVNQSRLICQGALTAGEKTCAKNIPGSFAGQRVLFQAAMRDTCPDPCMSDLLDMVIQ